MEWLLYVSSGIKNVNWNHYTDTFLQMCTPGYLITPNNMNICKSKMFPFERLNVHNRSYASKCIFFNVKFCDCYTFLLFEIEIPVALQ
jgi:hypothetical protein